MDQGVIIVVGRSKTLHSFLGEVAEVLYGGYGPFAVHPLGEPYADGKERFLAFVGIAEETEFDVETQVERLLNAQFGAKHFASTEEALAHAVAEYQLNEDYVHAHERLEEIRQEFPMITAEEAEQYVIVDSLMHLGRVTIMPALLDDERAVAIVQVTSGPDGTRVTPLAFLASGRWGDPDNLKLPSV